MRYFAVNPKWGYRSVHFHIVAALDEIDAARRLFGQLKPSWDRQNRRPPELYRVAPMLDPDEFAEDVERVRLADDHDSSTQWEVVEEMFGDFVEVRL